MAGFAGRTALITGSGTGIGLAIARAFARGGAGVIILGRRAEPLRAAKAELDALAAEAGCGAKITAFPGVDVADEAAVTSMFDEIEAGGERVDILVNNAGVSGPVTCFSNAPEADFDSAVDIHLTGTFWTSVQALRVMRRGGIIITITTFFTEERPLEQRPYRFRTPYTAAQGAKNRLAEALAAELVERGIRSIATNPGPVHSDRIYKTVYPKAAAEFLRVGGFESLDAAGVEATCKIMLPALGEGGDAVRAAAAEAASKVQGAEAGSCERLLSKVGEIAEKIQRNTAAMIADGQFLSQEQVAGTVLALCEPGLAATLSGKVIPGDRVFYPVRAHVGARTPRAHEARLEGRAVLIAVGAGDEAGCAAAEAIAEHAEARGGKAVLVIGRDVPAPARESLSRFHSHEGDLGPGGDAARWLSAASRLAGGIAAVVHVTGNVPPGAELCAQDRAAWDALVSRFVTDPARTVRAAMAELAGGGSDPRAFAGAGGRIVIVGPSLPSSRKAPRGEAARAEVFRGALRPLVTTINQELSDVLKSEMRTLLFLPGSVAGAEPGRKSLADAMDYALSDASTSSPEVIFCIDESR